MLVLGHLGFGVKLASPWSHGLQRRFVLFGTLLPDIIDKPLYYGLSFATGKHGQDLGLISSSRTIGHSALLLFLVLAVAAFRKSKVLAAVALGMATHLLLDNLSDHFVVIPSGSLSTVHALLWPFLGWQFPIQQASSLHDHALIFLQPFFYWTEGIGFLLLCWETWKYRHKTEILRNFKNHRKLYL